MKLFGTALRKIMALCALAVICHCNGFGYDAGLPGFGARKAAGSFAVVENGILHLQQRAGKDQQKTD